MKAAVCVGLTNSAVCAGAFCGCFPTAGREGWRQIPASRTAARRERSPWACAAAGSRNRGGTRASPRHGRCRGTRACRPRAGRGRRMVRCRLGSWDGGLRRARYRGTWACRPHAGRGRRTARCCRGSWDGGLRHARRAGTRVCHLHAERDRFAVTVDARRSLSRMLPSESGLRIPRLARGLFAGVFPRPVGRVGGKFLRAGRLRAANGTLVLARRSGFGIAAEGGLSLAVRVAPERGLPSLRGTRSENGALPSRFRDGGFHRVRRGGTRDCRLPFARGARLAVGLPTRGRERRLFP